MARKSPTQPQQKAAPVELVVSREDAASKISQRIELAKELVPEGLSSWEQLKEVKSDYFKWSAYNRELLKRLFTDDSIAREYDGWSIGVIGSNNFYDEVAELKDDVNEKVKSLESISARLELIPEPQTEEPVRPIITERTANNKAFVVHGHDEGVRESVARFLEKLGIEAIILNEQASGNLTLIEKLERYSDVDFAVVLLTPDDVGAKASETEKLQPRARQNVVLELGYFMGKLGRRKVCALYKGGVELPSDVLGIVYVPLGDSGWRFLLAKELKDAGFSVDMNNI